MDDLQQLTSGSSSSSPFNKQSPPYPSHSQSQPQSQQPGQGFPSTSLPASSSSPPSSSYQSTTSQPTMKPLPLFLERRLDPNFTSNPNLNPNRKPNLTTTFHQLNPTDPDLMSEELLQSSSMAEEDLPNPGLTRMDSPEKGSEMSSTMCSTPSMLSMGLPGGSGGGGIAGGSGVSSGPVSILFGHNVIPLITPYGSPSSRPRSYADEHQSPTQITKQTLTARPIPPNLTLKLNTTRPFPSSTSTAPSSPPLTSPLLSSRSKSLPNLPRSVTFCSDPPSIWPAYEGEEYDRSPHPVVVRLSYRDVLELREMKVELGIVTRRQTSLSSGGVGGGVGARKVSDPVANRSGPGNGNGLGFGSIGGGGSYLNNTQSTNGRGSPMPEEETAPPSPSASFSSFPSSTRLISGLQRIPDPQPPRPASGMGLSFEPSFGLDSYARTDSNHGPGAGLGGGNYPGRRGRMNSNSSWNNGGKGEMSMGGGGGGMGPKRVQRKTSGDFSLEESTFKAELRAAKEELEKEELKAAGVRVGGVRASKAEKAVEASGGISDGGFGGSRSPSANGSGSGSGSGYSSVGGGDGQPIMLSNKPRTSSFFSTPPGATFVSGPACDKIGSSPLGMGNGSSANGGGLLAPPGKISKPNGLKMPSGGLGGSFNTLHSPLPERSPSPGNFETQLPVTASPPTMLNSGTTDSPTSTSTDSTSGSGIAKRPDLITKRSLTFESHLPDTTRSPRLRGSSINLGDNNNNNNTNLPGTVTAGRSLPKRQESYTIQPPSPITAPYTRSIPTPLAVSTVLNTGAMGAEEVGFGSSMMMMSGRKADQTIGTGTVVKESRALQPPSPVLRPFTSSVRA